MCVSAVGILGREEQGGQGVVSGAGLGIEPRGTADAHALTPLHSAADGTRLRVPPLPAPWLTPYTYTHTRIFDYYVLGVLFCSLPTQCHNALRLRGPRAPPSPGLRANWAACMHQAPRTARPPRFLDGQHLARPPLWHEPGTSGTTFHVASMRVYLDLVRSIVILLRAFRDGTDSFERLRREDPPAGI